MDRDKQGQREKKTLPPGREAYDWVQALVTSVLAVVAVFTFAVRLMGVDGSSMRDTLHHNDRLLVVNALLCRDYQPGDIVIFRRADVFDGEPLVKRIVAVGGQTVDIDFSRGIVYVDGAALEEDYILEPTYTAEGTVFPLTVPEGAVFVMGDNRNGSSDSRDDRLGTVDRRYIIGRAVAVLLPGADAVTGRRDWGRVGVIGR